MASKSPSILPFCHFHVLSANDPDFSAAYLRQTVLLSAYETPEMRALYHGSLMNVAGKIRTDKRWSAVSVPEGVDQARVRA